MYGHDLQVIFCLWESLKTRVLGNVTPSSALFSGHTKTRHLDAAYANTPVLRWQSVAQLKNQFAEGGIINSEEFSIIEIIQLTNVFKNNRKV